MIKFVKIGIVVFIFSLVLIIIVVSIFPSIPDYQFRNYGYELLIKRDDYHVVALSSPESERDTVVLTLIKDNYGEDEDAYIVPNYGSVWTGRQTAVSGIYFRFKEDNEEE